VFLFTPVQSRIHGCLGGAAVRHWTRDQKVASRPGRYQVN